MNQNSFGKALKVARKRSGLTQSGLADKIADVEGPLLTQQVISNWERDVNLPGDRFSFMVLCKALYQSNGLTSVEQINQLLEPAEQGALHGSEIAQWFPELVERDFIHQKEEVREPIESLQEEEQEEEEEKQEPMMPIPAPHSPLPASSATSPWEQQVIHQLFYLQQKLRQHLGAIGAVMIVMWLLGLFWRATDWWHEAQQTGQIMMALWGSNLLLIMLPSLIEQEAKHYPVLQLKLSRLSGAGSALTIMTGFLLWMEAIWQLYFESPLALWLLYPLMMVGVAYAYAAGVNVQFWFYRQRDIYERAYLRNTIMISLSSFAAQALLVWSCYFLYTQLPDIQWHVFMLTPALLMILRALRR